ncbi:DNA modification methylase [Lysobacteraceae bacterium NML120232]|nr:DNA modification methylase [Xanthomonadaceae bacterium NML120232]
MENQKQLFQNENVDYLQRQIITYIGNKRALLPLINEAISVISRRTGKKRLACLDLFSGSGIVARFLKKHSSTIHTNDIENYSSLTNSCYLKNSCEVDWNELDEAFHLWNEKIKKNWRRGFIAELYAPLDDENIKPSERVFYTRRNAEYLDTARAELEIFPEHIKTLLLAPLISRASIHANTSGVFKGFYKSKNGIGQFGGSGKNALSRITGEIKTEKPILSNFYAESKVFQQDATTFFEKNGNYYDVVYIDPPYNQHPYGSNYFMLNLLCSYKKPEEISKISGIPTNWNRSKFNKRQLAEESLFKTIASCNSRFVLISYNSEGFIPHENLLKFIKKLGSVELLQTQYNTFRGSRNLNDRSLHVTEFLYLLEKK